MKNLVVELARTKKLKTILSFLASRRKSNSKLDSRSNPKSDLKKKKDCYKYYKRCSNYYLKRDNIY